MSNEHAALENALSQLSAATGGIVFRRRDTRYGTNTFTPYISSQPMNQIEVDCSDATPTISFIVDGITVAQALAVAAVLYPERQAAK